MVRLGLRSKCHQQINSGSNPSVKAWFTHSGPPVACRRIRSGWVLRGKKKKKITKGKAGISWVDSSLRMQIIWEMAVCRSGLGSNLTLLQWKEKQPQSSVVCSLRSLLGLNRKNNSHFSIICLKKVFYSWSTSTKKLLHWWTTNGNYRCGIILCTWRFNVSLLKRVNLRLLHSKCPPPKVSHWLDEATSIAPPLKSAHSRVTAGRPL